MVDRRDDLQSGSGFRRISTEDLRQSDRFDYWRSLFPRMDLRLAGSARADGFAGSALLCADARGVTFGHSTNAGVVAGRTRGDSDFIMISATVAGATRVRRGYDPALEVTPTSGVGVYDASQPMSTLSEDHAHLYITLPRAVVIEGLDGDVGFLRKGPQCLPQTGLSRSLHEHLRMMALDAKHLDGASTQVAMQIAADLALGILASERAPTPPTPRDHSGELHARALQFIHLHHADPSLVAATIAYDLGCSRAHLYRVFAQQGQCVGEIIRSIRIARASALLKARPSIPLSRIAMLCGYESVNGLSRAFARGMGTTPARFRAERQSVSPLK